MITFSEENVSGVCLYMLSQLATIGNATTSYMQKLSN